ncbi:6514_t:CDS:2 [Scutellospora calospora]|uniref:6514_t:CDS:1 n=1 Tax=Scutellospora calospora TaxID=85575 RepID=A0ACA9K7R6_9GLOM|nr:6514_t:CDS:2 [Scutellospora calospora]
MAKNSRKNADFISLKYTSFEPQTSKDVDNYTEDELMDPLLSDNSHSEEIVVTNDESDNLYIESAEGMRIPRSGGSVFSSFLNMANSIIGAAGIFTGMILLVGLTFVVDWTIRLLVLNSKLSGRSSYQDIMYFCFGKSGMIAISLFQFVFAFGGMCAFCVIIGDTIPEVIKSIFPGIVDIPVLYLFGTRNFIIIICTVFVSYPLALYRDISKLAKASGLALISMVIIVVSVAVEGPQVTPSLRGSDVAKWDFIHPDVFQVFYSYSMPTMNRFAVVTHLSTFVSMIACMLMALIGYLVFTDKTQVITTLLVGSAMIISLMTSSLGTVLELTGGFSATALAYILPPACYLKLSSGKLLTLNKLPAILCVIFGILVMVLSTILSIANIISGWI